MPQSSTRFHVVDALRGFAIVSIMLLHNIEHFDFWYTAEGIPDWMVNVDKGIWNTLFFLFGGKSYGIFALLFGLTFFIQSNNQEKKGRDFRLRFAWRLVLLLGFGILNSTFYQGDILSLYAVVGFFLILFSKLSNRWVGCAIIVLLLLPYNFYQFIAACLDPEKPWANPKSWTYFGKMGSYITGDSILAVFKGNLTNGKISVVLWNWENGRYFQMLALFLWGMLLGRQKRFVNQPENTRFWIRILVLSTIAFAILYPIKINAGHLFSSRAMKETFLIVETSWCNLSFMLMMVSSFVLIFRLKFGAKILGLFVPIGKMSLSNYIFQSMAGAVIYYGFGFGLYQYTGATYASSIGLGLAILFWIFCTIWMKRFRHGPFEYLWHKATWIGSPSK